MATYRISGPDGHAYQVTAPDGASQADVLAYVQKNAAPQPQASDKGAVVSGVHGALDAATFGLFDKAAPYVGAALTGESVDQARQEISGNVAATTEAHPIAHAIGEVGGAVAGGGALEHAGVKVLSKLAPDAVKAASASLALQKGQPLRNLARLGAQATTSAAAYGAASGAVQGSSDGAGGAVMGALKGGGAAAALPVVAAGIGTADLLHGDVKGAALPLVLSAAPFLGAGAVKAGAAVRTALSDTSAKAISALAKKFNMAPADLDAAYKNYTADAGHSPSLAEIADLQSRGELQSLARRNPVVGASVETARAKAAGELPTYLSQKAAATVGQPQDLADLVTARSANATKAMDPIRSQHIGLSPDEADFMRGDITQHMGIKGPARHEIADQLSQGTLSLANADTIRKNLSAQAFAKPGEGYDQLLSGFNDIVRSASPEYGRMLDQYAADSRYIDSFEHGQTGKTVGQTSDPGLINALGTPEGQSGYMTGQATRIHDRLAKSEASAASMADELSQNAATAHNATRTFGAPADSLARAARAKLKGLENLSVIAGSGTPQPNESKVGLTHAALAAMGTLKGRIYHAVQAASAGIRLSPAVQSKIGDMLTDPKQSQKAIAYLRAQGARDHDLRVLMTQVAKMSGRPAGAAAAYLTNQQ